MKALLDYDASDSLTAVELPDRHMLDSCDQCIFVIWIDAFNNWTVFSNNDIATAVNNCYNYGGNVTQVGHIDPENTIDPSITNSGIFTDTSSITDPAQIIQIAQVQQDNTVVCDAQASNGPPAVW